MNRALLFSAVVLLAGCNKAVVAGTSVSSSAAEKASSFEQVILLHSDTSAVAADVIRGGGAYLRNMEVVNGVVASLPPGLAKQLETKFRGLKAIPDIEFSIVNPSLSVNAKPGGGTVAPQPPQSVPWGIAAIKSRAANGINRGAGVKVCVIDTGVDKIHPDLQANIAGGRNFVFAKGTVDPNNWSDDNGHGSHVAGTIAALDNSIGVVGVAPDAKIYAVKVLNSRGSGSLSDVADGVGACVAAGAKVINMSLGATSDPAADSPLKTAIANAQAAGVIVVVAAGNEGQDISRTVPAGYPATIAVAAVDSAFKFPSWSNFGLSADDYTAPGVSVLSTWKSGQYNTISGTSMASPHVAGVAALMLSSGGIGFKAVDLFKTVSIQGAGLVDALATVENQPVPTN